MLACLLGLNLSFQAVLLLIEPCPDDTLSPRNGLGQLRWPQFEDRGWPFSLYSESVPY